MSTWFDPRQGGPYSPGRAGRAARSPGFWGRRGMPGHDHAHHGSAGGHAHGSGRRDRAFAIGAALNTLFIAAASFGVVLAAVAIGLTGWLWLDPLASLGIAAVILIGTWSVLRESTDLAMDAVPGRIEGVVAQATAEVRERFGIGHATLQVETTSEAEACRLRPHHVI